MDHSDQSDIGTGNGTTHVIVGCGSQKAQTKQHAKDLYTSTYFQKKREYAETIGDRWSILSAKYGSLDPSDAVVAPYDLTIDDYPTDSAEYPDAPYETLDEWGTDFLNGVENRVSNYERLDQYEPLEEIVLLLGQKYLSPIRDGLEDLADEHDFAVRTPFEDTSGNGEQMQWLSEQVEQENQSEHDSDDTEAESTAESTTSVEIDDTEDQSGLDVWSV